MRNSAHFAALARYVPAMILLMASLATATSYSVPIPGPSGMFDVRPWDLPAPVLLADGTLLRAHYDGKALIVTRLGAGGTEVMWTHSLSAPRSVASPTTETHDDVSSLAGSSPWMLDADAELTRVFTSFGGGSSTVVLATKTGKVAIEKPETNNGFSGALTEGSSGVFATVRSHASELSVQTYDSKGRALASVTGKVPPHEFDAMRPWWVLKGLADSALGTDGTVALAVGEGRGRIHLERWTVKSGNQVGTTLIDGFAKALALRQLSDGSTLAILRTSKPGPGYATTDLVACVAPAGPSLAATCLPVGLDQIVGKNPSSFVAIATEPTSDGGFIVAVQADKDMIGQSNVTRIRGDIFLIAIRGDGTVAWHTQAAFKTSTPISFSADALASPATLIRHNEIVYLVTAAPFGGIFNQQWHLEAAALDPASGTVGRIRWKRDTKDVPVTGTLQCVGSLCSMLEANSEGAKIAIFDAI